MSSDRMFAAAGRRRIAALAVTAVVAALVVPAVVIPAQHALAATSLVTQSFTTDSVTDPNFTVTGSAAGLPCLTASTTTPGGSSVPDCPAGQADIPAGGDTNGKGALRLTDNTGNDSGALLYNKALPLTQGADISFDYAMYGNPSTTRGPADGINIFLADGSVPLTVGAAGGSLGYAQKDGANTQASSDAPGVTKGYLGLGLDEFGNYELDTEGRGTSGGGAGTGGTSSCTATASQNTLAGSQVANQVGLRGPGTGYNNYCLLDSVQLNQTGQSLHGSGATHLAPGTLETVRMVVDPPANANPKVTVYLAFNQTTTDTVNPTQVFQVAEPPNAPSTFHFGIAASTGGAVDIHEILNLSVKSVNTDPTYSVAQTDDQGQAFHPGSSATFNLVPTLVSGTADPDAPTVVETLPAGVTLASLPTPAGYTCTGTIGGQTVSCTYTGTLPIAVGTTLPRISIAVNVSGTATGQLTASALATSADSTADTAGTDTATVVGPNAINMTVPQANACGTNPVFINSGYETPVAAAKSTELIRAANSTNPAAGVGWSTNDAQGIDEIWSTGFVGTAGDPPIPSDTGNQFSELDGYGLDTQWQDIATTPGTVIDWSFAHRGRYGNDTMDFEAGVPGTVQTAQQNPTKSTVPVPAVSGASILSKATDGAGEWGHYSGRYTVPAGQTTTRFAFQGVSSTRSDDDGNFLDSNVIALESNACNDSYTVPDGPTTTTLNVLSNDVGTNLTASLPAGSTAPSHGTVSLTGTGAGNKINYTPVTGYYGTDSFTYTATDATGNTSTATVTVTIPAPPTVTPLTSTGPTPASQTAVITVPSGDTASLLDANGNPTASPVPVAGQGSYTLGSDGKTITFTPVAGFTGKATPVSYRVTDTFGDAASSTYTPTVVPVALDDTKTVTYSNTTPTLSATVPTPLGTGPFTYTKVTGPADAAANGFTFDPSSGAYTYSPAGPFTGTDSFTYTVTDGGGTSNTATVTLNVNASPAPTAVPESFTASAQVVSGGTTGTPSASVNVVNNDQNVVGIVTAVITSQGTHGTAKVSADGQSIIYTPTDGSYSGPDSFVYHLVDQFKQSSNSVTEPVTITPFAVNDTITSPFPNATTLPTTTLTSNDDPSTLTVTAVTAIPGTTKGTVSLSSDGTSFTYTPPATYPAGGTDTFTYTATDGANPTTATVTVKLTPIAPTAANYNLTAMAGSPATQVVVGAPGVLSNDSGTGLVPTLTTKAAKGTATVNPDGSYTYTPINNYSGPDSFGYTVTDVAGQTATGTVNVTVVPVGVADSYKTAYVTPVTITPAGNDFGSGDTVTSVTQPKGGAVVLNANGSYTYTPALGTVGPDTFTYLGQDQNKQPYGPVTVTVTVAAPGQPVANDDNAGTTPPVAATTAGTPITINVVGNDSSTTGLVPTIASHTGNATPTVNTDGTINYQPVPDFSGTDTFTYFDTDTANQQSNIATVTVVVKPTAGADATKTPFNTALTQATTTLLGNDHGSGLTVTAVNAIPGTTKGSVALSADGKSFVYTPATNFFGNDTFAYTDTDASGQTVSSTVLVTVDAPTPPTATDHQETTTTGTPLTQPAAANLLAGSTGTSVTVIPQNGVKTAAGGTVTVKANGDYTYTPPVADYSGPDSFPYTVIDPANQTATGTVTIAVTPTAAPDAITVPNSSPGYTAATSTLLTNDHGSGLAVTGVSATSLQGGTVTLTGTSYTYVPRAGYTGSDSFTYTDTDNSTPGQTVTSTVNVTVLPPVPVAGDDTYTTTAGTPLNVQVPGVLSNDSGSGPLTVKAGSVTTPTSGGKVTVNADGSFTYTAPAATFSGIDTFTYVTSGAGGDSQPATVTITIKPVALKDSQGVIAGQTLSASTPTGVGTPALTYTVVTGPAHDTGSFALDPTTGAYTYTPVSGFTGSDSFTYTVTDSNGLVSAVVPVTITVGTPGAPQATNDTLPNAVSGTSTSGPASVLTNDTGDDLRVPAGSYTQPPAGQGSVAMKTDGTYVYTAPATFSGTTSFTYTPVDAIGQPATTPGTVTITVAPVAQPASEQTAQDTPATFTLPTPSGTGPFTYTVTSGPQAGAKLTPNGNGSFTYTPKPGAIGTDTFTYTVTGAGGTSAPATVSIGVGQAPAPQAVADTFQAFAGSPLTVGAPGVLINDSGDQPKPNFPATTTSGGTITPTTGGGFTYTAPGTGFSGTDTFSYTVTDVNNVTSAPVIDTITVKPVANADSYAPVGGSPFASPTSLLDDDNGTGLTVVNAPVKTTAGGTLTVDPKTGDFTYTAPVGFKGTDTFTYQVQDASNQTSTTATVTLDVLEPAPPVGVADSLPVAAGSSATTSPTSVLANDSGAGLTISTFTPPTAGGTLALNTTTGFYTYTPPAGFSGTDTFTYTPVDAYKQTGQPVTVTVTVAPVAAPDSQTVRSGTVLTASVPAPTGSGTFTYQVSTPPAHGTVTLDPATGNYTYTPAPNYLGADTFAYTVTGAGGTSAPAQISINIIKPVAPTGSASSAPVKAGTPASGSVAGNDTGFGPLTTAVAAPPAHGTVTVNPGGTYTYTPAAGYSGPDSFTYTITDPFGQTSPPVTVTLTISPVAVADTNQTAEGTPASGNVLTNDLGTGLTAVPVSGPTHGTLTLNPNGTYAYAPAPGFAGTDSFTYSVTGAGGTSAPATVTITVVAVTPVIVGGTSQTIGLGTTPAPITVTGPSGSTQTVTTTKPGSLPPGVKLGPTGSFTGTATKPGTYTFPVTVTDPAGGTSTRNVTIVVTPAPIHAVSSVAAVTTVGNTVNLPLGGTITKVTGTLPPGIKVLGTSLVGKGTRPGKYTVTVTLKVKGQTVTRKVTITVKPRPAVAPTQPTRPLSFTGAPVSMLLGWALALLALGLALVGFAAFRRRRGPGTAL